MDEANLLEVKELETRFVTGSGPVKAVDNVSFYIKPGETVGIVGESGSGKSVTSLSIMRLIQSPPGEINNGIIRFRKDIDKEPVDLLAIAENQMRHYRGQ